MYVLSCMLDRVRVDAEARHTAGQRLEVAAAAPHLQFSDPELVRAFRDVRHDVGLGLAGSGPDLTAWPAQILEDDRLESMRSDSGPNPINMMATRTAEALVRHELGWFGWALCADPRCMHGELATLGAASFAVNGMWRPAVPGPHATDV